MRKILFTQGATALCFRIPKRRGKGYLKSCFGWHTTNEQSKEFEQLLQEAEDSLEFNGVYYKEYADIEGYLDLETSYETRLRGRRSQFVKSVLACLLAVFPHCDGIEEVSWNDFFESLNN
jgi:hypothetical protein